MADFPNATASDGSLLIAANNVSSTLNGGISAAAAAATLASTVHFPSKGGITIESEAILYTANNTATSVLTLGTRGADSTTAAIHADGTAVYMHNQARHHNALKDEIIAIESNIFSRFGTGTSSVDAIKGTVTNNNAISGYVGEYLGATGTANATTSTQYGDLAILSLTAGDWNVCALANFDRNGATWSQAQIGIGTVAGNDSTGLTGAETTVAMEWTNSSALIHSVPLVVAPVRVSLAANSTRYLKFRSTYTAGGPPSVAGVIKARRER